MEDLYDEIVENLRDWFSKSKSKGGKPGWVQVVSGKPCARQPGQKTTPKCVSSAKRASMSKKERESAQRRKREADPGQPQKSGAAKPTYVSTDKKKKKKSKKNEDLYMSLEKIVAEELEAVLDEKKKKKKKSGKKDACYHKVKSRYKVWPSAYASGALVKCRKVGAKNWGNSKKESLQIMIEDELSQVLLETHSAKHEKELEKISDELAGASKMHKGQAERLKGMGFKHGGEMEYGHGGDVKKKKMGYADGGEAKPDFLDMDKDGDRKESMKKAVKDKKMKRMKHGGMVMKIVKKLKDKK